MHTKAERTEKVEEIKAENREKVKEIRQRRKSLMRGWNKARQVTDRKKRRAYYIQTVYACYCTGNCYGTGAYYNYSIQS
ncbi:MAG: hypothetical protein ACLS9K_03620 [Lachnospira eligens]